jgi:hypothetical protein
LGVIGWWKYVVVKSSIARDDGVPWMVVVLAVGSLLSGTAKTSRAKPVWSRARQLDTTGGPLFLRRRSEDIDNNNNNNTQYL